MSTTTTCHPSTDLVGGPGDSCTENLDAAPDFGSRPLFITAALCLSRLPAGAGGIAVEVADHVADAVLGCLAGVGCTREAAAREDDPRERRWRRSAGNGVLRETCSLRRWNVRCLHFLDANLWSGLGRPQHRHLRRSRGS